MQRSDGRGAFQAVDRLNGKLLCGCNDVNECTVRCLLLNLIAVCNTYIIDISMVHMSRSKERHLFSIFLAAWIVDNVQSIGTNIEF